MNTNSESRRQNIAPFVVIRSEVKILGRIARKQRQRCFDKLSMTAWCILLPSATFAATLVTSSVDGGGRRAASASYTMDGCIGGLAGVSTVASPPETVKAGYIGQLAEVTSLVVTAAPTSINQGATSQLSGTATLDDQTVSGLAGSDIAWGAVTYPFQSVNSAGLLTAAANVYASPVGNVYGSYLGATSNAIIQVIGPYANSGIPDSWSAQYFGPAPNANAAPAADPDGDSQCNLFEYTAGLDPTNPASIFVLAIAAVPGQPNQKALIWKPWASGRTYAPEFRTNLEGGAYADLAGYGGPATNSTEITITDLNATQPDKFYRIRISMP